MTDVLYVSLRQHGVERTPKKSQHAKLSLEKKILPLLLPGLELATFPSRVQRSTNKLSRIPEFPSDGSLATNDLMSPLVDLPGGLSGIIGTSGMEATPLKLARTLRMLRQLHPPTPAKKKKKEQQKKKHSTKKLFNL